MWLAKDRNSDSAEPKDRNSDSAEPKDRNSDWAENSAVAVIGSDSDSVGDPTGDPTVGDTAVGDTAENSVGAVIVWIDSDSDSIWNSAAGDPEDVADPEDVTHVSGMDVPGFFLSTRSSDVEWAGRTGRVLTWAWPRMTARNFLKREPWRGLVKKSASICSVGQCEIVISQRFE